MCSFIIVIMYNTATPIDCALWHMTLRGTSSFSCASRKVVMFLSENRQQHTEGDETVIVLLLFQDMLLLLEWLKRTARGDDLSEWMRLSSWTKQHTHVIDTETLRMWLPRTDPPWDDRLEKNYTYIKPSSCQEPTARGVSLPEKSCLSR